MAFDERLLHVSAKKRRSEEKEVGEEKGVLWKGKRERKQNSQKYESGEAGEG